MPELPDVETFRRYLGYTALHKVVESVDVRSPEMLSGVSLDGLRSELGGTSLEETERHGKYLFARTGRGRWLVLHFGMTGRLAYYRDPGSEPEHARLVLGFENGYSLAMDDRRKLGSAALTGSPGEFAEQRELGPDALLVGSRGFAEALGRKRGMVKSALMDQSTVSGVGNVYADEILFRAGVHPAADVGGMGRGSLVELYGHLREVLETAIDVQADPDRLPDDYLIPRRREGGRCPVCGGELETTKVSGRTTYYCRRRQGRGRRG